MYADEGLASYAHHDQNVIPYRSKLAILILIGLNSNYLNSAYVY